MTHEERKEPQIVVQSVDFPPNMVITMDIDEQITGHKGNAKSTTDGVQGDTSNLASGDDISLDSRAQDNALTQRDIAENKPLSYCNAYFVCYMFYSFSQGIAYLLPGSLFSEMSDQLHTTKLETSYIMLSCSIGVIVGSISAGFVVDRFTSTHRYVAVFSTMEAVIWCLIPLINNYAVQMTLWGLLGIATGEKAIALPVYVYRLWKNASTIFITLLASLGMGKICSALFIQLSVSQFGSYSYALWSMAFIPLVAAVMLVILPCPQHNKLRSLESAMDARESNLAVSAIYEKMKQHRRVEYATICSLSLFFLFYGFVRAGITVHISVYCDEYLLKPVFSRYLLSTYALGEIGYRIGKAALRDGPIIQRLNTTKATFKQLFLIVSFEVIFLVIWIVAPFKHKIPILFAVFCGSGIIMADIPPAVLRLTESVTTINGKMTCLHLVMYYVGDIAVVALNGSVIHEKGARYYPYAACIGAATLGIPIVLLSWRLHRFVTLLRVNAMNGVRVDCPQDLYEVDAKPPANHPSIETANSAPKREDEID